jgi:ADP-heptose:LPS heptosyltransferase
MSFGIRRFLLLVFSYIKFLYYSCLSIFSKEYPPEQKEIKSLLIIKLDEIGDYILFRNLLRYFKASEKFNGYKITLCGNIVWKSIFDFLDKDYIDSSIWINKIKFSRNMFYRNSIIKFIKKVEYNTVINGSLSRVFFTDDTLVKAANAKFKIGSKTDFSNQFHWQKKISDSYYSELIEVNDENVFEFHRNKDFVSKVLKTEIHAKAPVIEKDNLKYNNELVDTFAIFYLGGRAKYKIWDTKNFISVAKHIYEKFNLKIVLLGDAKDIEFSKKFKNHFENKYVIDFTSKTNLIEVLEILNNAQIAVMNDSGLAHIAAGLNKKIIVLVNGTHLGRFFPYPESFKNVKSIHPPVIENNLKNFKNMIKEYKYRSTLDINSISVERVIEEIDNLLV